MTSNEPERTTQAPAKALLAPNIDVDHLSDGDTETPRSEHTVEKAVVRTVAPSTDPEASDGSHHEESRFEQTDTLAGSSTCVLLNKGNLPPSAKAPLLCDSSGEAPLDPDGASTTSEETFASESDAQVHDLSTMVQQDLVIQDSTAVSERSSPQPDPPRPKPTWRIIKLAEDFDRVQTDQDQDSPKRKSELDPDHDDKSKEVESNEASLKRKRELDPDHDEHAKEGQGSPKRKKEVDIDHDEKADLEEDQDSLKRKREVDPAHDEDAKEGQGSPNRKEVDLDHDEKADLMEDQNSLKRKREVDPDHADEAEEVGRESKKKPRTGEASAKESPRRDGDDLALSISSLETLFGALVITKVRHVHQRATQKPKVDHAPITTHHLDTVELKKLEAEAKKHYQKARRRRSYAEKRVKKIYKATNHGVDPAEVDTVASRVMVEQCPEVHYARMEEDRYYNHWQELRYRVLDRWEVQTQEGWNRTDTTRKAPGVVSGPGQMSAR